MNSNSSSMMHKLKTLSLLSSLVLLSIAMGFWLAARSGFLSATPVAAAQAAGLSGTVVQAPSPSIEVPPRKPHAREVAADPRQLPDSLRKPRELTIELAESPVTGHERHTSITRSAERVHLRTSDREQVQEWLFVRNPVDPRRVSAARIDHAHKTILEYEESALRNDGIARDWLQVVSLGVEPERLEQLAVGDSIAGLTGTVRALREAIDPSLLADPRRRFPSYVVIDSVDALEKDHDH